MINLFVIILFVIVTGNSVCTYDRNGCYYNSNRNDWVTNSYIPQACSAQCMCPDGCTLTSNDRECHNLSQSYPISELQFPQYCAVAKADTDIQCNRWGNGTDCPTGCTFDNILKKCWSSEKYCEPIVNVYCIGGSFNESLKIPPCDGTKYQEICITNQILVSLNPQNLVPYLLPYLSGDFYIFPIPYGHSVKYPKYRFGYSSYIHTFTNFIEYPHIIYHLSDQYKFQNIQCKSSYKGDCEGHRVLKRCC